MCVHNKCNCSKVGIQEGNDQKDSIKQEVLRTASIRSVFRVCPMVVSVSELETLSKMFLAVYHIYNQCHGCTILSGGILHRINTSRDRDFYLMAPHTIIQGVGPVYQL